jgi:hypothetical protein
MFMKVLQVTGAYGRSYDMAVDAIQDWFGGRDFLIMSGPYVSNRDTLRLLEDGYSHVHIIDYETSKTLAVLMLGQLTK